MERVELAGIPPVGSEDEEAREKALGTRLG